MPSVAFVVVNLCVLFSEFEGEVSLLLIVIVNVLNLCVVKYECGSQNQSRSFMPHVKCWLECFGFVGMYIDVGVSDVCQILTFK